MKYYLYKDIKIYVFILTLRNNSDWRIKLLNENIVRNPKINIMYGIDGHDPDIEDIFKKLQIEIKKHWRNPKAKIYGKLGVWLSKIILAKISFDTKKNIIILEDDLYIPNNFNFQFEKFIEKNNCLIRLGKYGDGFCIKPMISKKYLEIVYQKGIDRPNDIFTAKFIPNQQINVISRDNYSYQKKENIQTHKSCIRDRDDYVDFYYYRNINSKKPLLIRNKIKIKNIPNDLKEYIISICN